MGCVSLPGKMHDLGFLTNFHWMCANSACQRRQQSFFGPGLNKPTFNNVQVAEAWKNVDKNRGFGDA